MYRFRRLIEIEERTEYPTRESRLAIHWTELIWELIDVDLGTFATLIETWEDDGKIWMEENVWYDYGRGDLPQPVEIGSPEYAAICAAMLTAERI